MLFLEPCPWIRATGPHTGDAEHLLVLQGPEGCHIHLYHTPLYNEGGDRQCTTPSGGINVPHMFVGLEDLEGFCNTLFHF